MEAAASMHVRFLYAEQTFRFMMRGTVNRCGSPH